MLEYFNPYVPTIKLIGGTGTGKTEIAIAFAEPRAREVLKRCVGTTNSTLCEKLFVYTDDPKKKDEIVVAVEKNKDLLEREKFVEILVNALAKVVIENGKAQVLKVEENKEKIKQYFIEEIDKICNKRTVLGVLNEDPKKDIAEKIAKICIDDSYGYCQHFFEIYYETKNNMTEIETKGNSEKFLYAIQVEIEKSLDLMEKEFKERIWKCWEEINKWLNNIFDEYFEEGTDNLYVKKINLEKQDKKDKHFIDHMFTSNDVWEGEGLSLEIFCNKIYIHVPLRTDISSIKKNEGFCNTLREKTQFGIQDTCGLKNCATKEDLNEIIYRGNTEALVFVMPMIGDANAEEFYELYCSALSKYKRRIPIFIVCNKADLYIEDRIGNKLLDIEPLLEQLIDEKTIEIEHQIKQKIDEKTKQLKEEINKIKNTSRKDEIEVYPCVLARSSRGSRAEKIINDYNIENVLEKIIENVDCYLQEISNNKILIKKDITIDDMNKNIEINKVKLQKEIHKRINEITTQKKVFSPGMLNINWNMGGIPDTESYKLLKKRLKYGEGYTSNMCEAYYYKCKSFSVDFTANLHNFCDGIHEIIKSVVELDKNNVFCVEDGYEKFLKKISDNIENKRFVSILLYDGALYEAEKNNFSSEKKFRIFLMKSKSHFVKEEIDEGKFCDALEKVIREAVQRTLEMNCCKEEVLNCLDVDEETKDKISALFKIWVEKNGKRE